MQFGGPPWTEASKTSPQYSKFISVWDNWLSMHPDGQVTENEYPRGTLRLFQEVKPVMKILLLKMLHPNPEKRIKIQDVMNDRWLKAVDCCTLEGYEGIGDPNTKDAAIDASKVKSCKLKKAVQKPHNHLPPPPKSKVHLPQHRFDMGDGW